MTRRAVRTGRRRGTLWRIRLYRAVPPWPELLLGTLGWAGLTAASSLLSVWRLGWTLPQAFMQVAFLFAVGSAIAWPLAAIAIRLTARSLPPGAAYALAFLVLATTTIGVTSGFYALWYRDYYADWHATVFTTEWAFQFAFTVGGAVYQFLVLGLPMYMPVGFAGLFAASFLLARTTR
ncbi:MAG: hypothetical protein K5872_21840 [Rhizobiaceae bacterium]|nr:hypothetical protein [Rhizobiaceae bacterium]MCV0408861.1 hypothetical protein [Rhizobiaceae bacterium]